MALCTSNGNSSLTILAAGGICLIAYDFEIVIHLSFDLYCYSVTELLNSSKLVPSILFKKVLQAIQSSLNSKEIDTLTQVTE